MGIPPAHIRELLERDVRNNPRQLARVVDYLLVPTHDHGGRAPAGHERPIELAEGVRIERLDGGLADRLLDATALRGENWAPTRTFHVVHAYIRDVWSVEDGAGPEKLYQWDHEERIWPTVQLSRLIRDNNTSTEHAVRRLIHADGSERLIPFDGYASHVVYRLYPDREGWLDASEAAELSVLLGTFWQDAPLPDRVRRAVRQVDAITSERYLEDAMPLVVCAFESLVKIGRRHVTAQFSQRVPSMAAEVGVELTIAECEEIYDDRSALVHGAAVDLSQPHDIDDFGRRFNLLQETLRRVTRRAIEDRDFAAVFEDEASIAERWPAVVKVRVEVEKSI